jgi:hypothetical protein
MLQKPEYTRIPKYLTRRHLLDDGWAKPPRTSLIDLGPLRIAEEHIYDILEPAGKFMSLVTLSLSGNQDLSTRNHAQEDHGNLSKSQQSISPQYYVNFTLQESGSDKRTYISELYDAKLLWYQENPMTWLGLYSVLILRIDDQAGLLRFVHPEAREDDKEVVIYFRPDASQRIRTKTERKGTATFLLDVVINVAHPIIQILPAPPVCPYDDSQLPPVYTWYVNEVRLVQTVANAGVGTC